MEKKISHPITADLMLISNRLTLSCNRQTSQWSITLISLGYRKNSYGTSERTYRHVTGFHRSQCDQQISSVQLSRRCNLYSCVYTQKYSTTRFYSGISQQKLYYIGCLYFWRFIEFTTLDVSTCRYRALMGNTRQQEEEELNDKFSKGCRIRF